MNVFYLFLHVSYIFLFHFNQRFKQKQRFTIQNMHSTRGGPLRHISVISINIISILLRYQYIYIYLYKININNKYLINIKNLYIYIYIYIYIYNFLGGGGGGNKYTLSFF